MVRGSYWYRETRRLTVKLLANHFTEQRKQATELACSLESDLTFVVAIIGISLIFAIFGGMARAQLLPDINVWLLGLAPAMWFVIRVATRGYRGRAELVVPASAMAMLAARHQRSRAPVAAGSCPMGLASAPPAHAPAPAHST